jgi:WD40 repeat protein
MAQHGKIFRVFVSSTFSDLKVERDVLQREVFPRLRELCLQRGCRFQAIDLRWGVSEEASLDQQTMKICLTELKRCQEVTPRPNFVVLLGDRYGWRPLPYEIPAGEFKEILSRVSLEDRELLLWQENQPIDKKGWYRRDDNAVPPVYVLQPRAGGFRELHAWEPVEQKLRAILMAAIEGIELPPEARQKYETSATHQEILYGALNPQVLDAHEHVFCFFRSIANVPLDEAARDFIDMDKEGLPDREAQERLSALKKELAAQLPGNIHTYQARWTGNGITTNHIDQLCCDVYQALARVIEAQIGKIAAEDDVTRERKAHHAFGQDRARHFLGRGDILTTIQNYLLGKDRQPLAVWGESGSGKSALLAEAACLVQKQHPKAVVVQRFIGATPASSDIRLLLQSLCREISRAYRAKEDNLPVEFRKLEEEFPRRLALAKPDRPLILILDALDQLSEAEQARRLYWLPGTLPVHVRLIVSTLPKEPYPVDESPFQAEGLVVLKKKLPGNHIVALDPMTPEEGGALLDTWLREAERSLQLHQREQVLGKFAANGLPFYLRLTFEEARHWRSYDEPGRTRLSPDIPGVIRDLFRRLSEPTKHGKALVSRSLGYLAAGKNGLTEEELLEVLSTEEDQAVMKDFRKRSPKSPDIDRFPVVVWSRLHFDLAPYLTERQAEGFALLAFYHRQLWEVVAEDYLSGVQKTACHASLARYFDKQPLYQVEGQWDSRNIRKVSELPYQQTHGELWDDLEKKTLCDLRFTEAKCAAGMTYDLIGDYNLALATLPEAQPEIQKEREHQARIKKYVNDIITYARAWNLAPQDHKEKSQKETILINPPEPLQAIPPIPDEMICKDNERIINASTLLDKLKAFSYFVGVETHNLLPYASIPGFCAQQAFNSADSGPVAKDAEKIFGSETGLKAILSAPYSRPSFNLHRACIRTLEGHSELINHVCITGDGLRALSASRDRTLRLWDLNRGECILVMSGHEDDVTYISITPDERLAVSSSMDHTLRLWDLITGRCLKIFDKLPGFYNPVCITPDGGSVIIGDSDAKLRIWDIEKDCCSILIDKKSESWRGGGIHCLGLTPDARKAFSANYDGTINIWDLQSRTIVATLKLKINHFYNSQSVIMSSDGKYILVCSYEDPANTSVNCSIQLWDLASGKCIRKFLGDGSPVYSLGVTLDFTLMVSGGEDKTVRLWDLTTGDCLRVFEGHLSMISSVSISFDGRFAASGSWDHTLRLWNLETGYNDKSFLEKLWHHPLCVCPDGRHALELNEDLTINLCDLETGQKLRKLEGVSAVTSDISTINTSPAGDMVILSNSEGELHFLNLESEQYLGTITLNDPPKGSPMIDISPDGRKALFGTHDFSRKHFEHKVRYLDLETGESRVIFEKSSLYGWAQFNPDSMTAVAFRNGEHMKLWEIDNDNEILSGPRWVLDPLALSFTGDGRCVVVTIYVGDESKGGLSIWNIRTGERILNLEDHCDAILYLSISPNSNCIITADYQGTILLLDLPTGKLLAILPKSSDFKGLVFHKNRLLIEKGSGRVQCFTIINYCQLPTIITPVRQWRFDPLGESGHWDEDITIICPACGKSSLPEPSAMETIKKLRDKDEGDKGDFHRYAFTLPDNFFEEPNLLSECPHCQLDLKYNPFIVDNRERWPLSDKTLTNKIYYQKKSSLLSFRTKISQIILPLTPLLIGFGLFIMGLWCIRNFSLGWILGYPFITIAILFLIIMLLTLTGIITVVICPRCQAKAILWQNKIICKICGEYQIDKE